MKVDAGLGHQLERVPASAKAVEAMGFDAYSERRVTIGLGSQIKPHITKRFSMPWGAPAAKMRELVLAMRAIWANWYVGAKLEFVDPEQRKAMIAELRRA